VRGLADRRVAGLAFEPKPHETAPIRDLGSVDELAPIVHRRMVTGEEHVPGVKGELDGVGRIVEHLIESVERLALRRVQRLVGEMMA